MPRLSTAAKAASSRHNGSRFPFVGPSYVYNSLNFDCQRSVNIFPVISEAKDSKSQIGMMGTPGLSQFAAPVVSPARNSWVVQDRCFFVLGPYLYEIFSDGTSTLRGTMLTSTGFVGISDNGTQICIVDGDNGYIFTLATNVFAQITSAGWRGSNTICYIDGYFMFQEPGTGVYYISAINDGSNIDSLDFASAEGLPDNIVGVAAVHKQGWLFGTESVEVVYDSGAADFPFQRIEGVFMQYGCIAYGSIATNANTVFWLGQDPQGSGIVWMANGYQPQRISTFAVEYALQGYADLSSATGYTYQEGGHYFYVLNFPENTWVYDVTTQQWHERCYLNTNTGLYERHRAECHAFAFGKHLVGDYENGIIYEQSLNIYDDNGHPKRWLRAAPHFADDEEYLFHKEMQIIMETGIGLESGADEDEDPQIMLRWSDDGGHTWSNSHWRSAGAVGDYRKRVIWRRLGRARDRVYEVSGSTNTKVFISAARLEISMGSA